MITYVNSKDAQLFEVARQALIDNGIDVTANFGVPEYLDKLLQLKEISPKYVRLPLYEDGHRDEEIFEINANERTIKVPASFAKNGVGVVSDELAETIWFQINRYFDIKDFGQAAQTSDGSEALRDGRLHILIQWEAPDGAHGASWAYAVDVDTDPDYVYFGWALTAEHLTAQAGNIKFGIRILEYDGDEIAYSFSTQPAQITVKPGLSFDLVEDGVDIENVADKMASRLMGGQIAHAPIFTTDLRPYITNLTPPEDPQEGTTPMAELEVVAIPPNDETYDAVAYKWYKKGSNDSEFNLIDPDDDAYSGQFTPSLTVTSSGEYYVVVFGMIEIVDNNEIIFANGEPSDEPVKFRYHASVASSKSIVCNIPAPIKLSIRVANDAVLVLNNDPAIILGITRQMVDNVAAGVVSVKLEKSASGALVEDPSTLALTEVDLSTKPIVTSVVDSVDEDGKTVATVTINMFKDTTEDEETVRELADEGYYKITIINTLNGDMEEVASDVLCRVVLPATAPEVSISAVDGEGTAITGNGIVGTHKIQALCTIPTGKLSDKLDIQWFAVSGEQDPADVRTDTPIEGATGNEFVPTRSGIYYFKATNWVHDTFATAISNTVTFTE